MKITYLLLSLVVAAALTAVAYYQFGPEAGQSVSPNSRSSTQPQVERQNTLPSSTNQEEAEAIKSLNIQ